MNVTFDYMAYSGPRADVNIVTTTFNIKNLKEKNTIRKFLNSLNWSDWFVTTVNPSQQSFFLWSHSNL